MFKIAMGSNSEPDTAQAIGDAIAQALSGLDGSPAQAGILINQGHRADATLLNAIQETWPALNLIGVGGPAMGRSSHLRLMLLSSPDLVFHLSRGRHGVLTASLSAEQALSSFVSDRQSLALHLTLDNPTQPWNREFCDSVASLLPKNCSNLLPLLPPFNGPIQIDRHYYNQTVLHDDLPILLATHRNAETHGWRLTRQHGIVRKQYGESIYEYDTLVNDRRRAKPAA